MSIQFFFLWNISHPTKNGAPTITPTADDEILPSTRKAISTFELAIDLVITYCDVMCTDMVMLC